MSKGNLYVIFGNALMVLAIGLFAWLLWRIQLEPLWIQYQEQANFPTAILARSTLTVAPTLTSIPTNMPTPTPAPTLTVAPTLSPTPIFRDNYLLEVPSINLRWVTHHIQLWETNDEPWGIPKTVLDRYGVVDYPHLAFPGEEGLVGIAGHRDMSGNPFWNLDKINTGDQINIVRRDGKDLNYTVYQVVTVIPDDSIFWNMKYPNELRLVTCLVGSTKFRVIVFAFQN